MQQNKTKHDIVDKKPNTKSAFPRKAKTSVPFVWM